MIVGNLDKKALEERAREIMDYFGEFIDDSRARELAKLGSNSVWESMNNIRMMLRAEGHDVPFRSKYRRAK